MDDSPLVSDQAASAARSNPNKMSHNTTMDCEVLKSTYLHPFWDLFCERHPWRTTKSLCFVDAYWAKEEQKITENEYIIHLVAHYRGIRHPPNEGRWMDICQATLYEPFAGSIRKHALETRYRPLKDTKIYEQLFRSCIRKDQDAVKTHLSVIEKTNPEVVPYVPLAVLGARERLSPILQLCLDKGAPFDRYLARACAKGGHDYPEVDKALTPYEETTRGLLEGRRGPDGKFTAEQLEEWYGGINW